MSKSACEPYHSALPDLLYNAWYEDGERRTERGEKQRQCPICCKWVWESFFRPDGPVPCTTYAGGEYLEPRKKPYHMVKFFGPDGKVSPLCADPPRPINLTQASWTFGWEAVTCPKCLALRTADGKETA